MSVRLTIENVPSLTSGDPVVKEIDGHGLVIGRAGHVDWTLPDPQALISSVHCEIDYRDGAYWLTDCSTNGTFVNGAAERLAGPWQLRDGDLISIGHYTVRAAVTAGAGAGGFGGFAAAAPAASTNVWGQIEGTPDRAAETDAFGLPKRKAIFSSGDRPVEEAFRQPEAVTPAVDMFGLGSGGGYAAPPAPAGGDIFGLGGGAAPAPAAPAYAAPPPASYGAPPAASYGAPPAASYGAPPAASYGAPPAASYGAPPAAWPGMPSPTPTPPPASGGASIWSSLTEPAAIDFTPPPPPAAEVPGLAPPVAPVAAPVAGARPANDSALFARFLAGAGMKARDVEDVPPESVLAAAGELLRQTADGLIQLLYARARLRNQFGVGAEVTTFQRAGNNPLKWTRSAEEALRQIVGKPDPGFLPGPQAVRGAFEDLQAHELALMAAMQEALKDTIQRFSPNAIRARPGRTGMLAKVLPQARDAALWQAYEAEFRGMADETEAAYLDVFAKNFKKAYSRNLAKVDQGS